MSLGIGGGGSKLASLLDDGECTIVNVSDVELEKVKAKNKILAVSHSARGQFKGSGKDPRVGQNAFMSVSDELLERIKGEIVFTSTGGGTGNGISTLLLRRLAEQEGVAQKDKTFFALLLPYLDRESYEFVENTINFLMDPVSAAIDSGNTGNIALFSNRVKFERRIPEADYNAMMIHTLKDFLAIPRKGAEMTLLDGHIDYQDFMVHISKPYFNHFCRFAFNPNEPFADQLRRGYNEFLLPPERPIEAMFLFECPTPDSTSAFYQVLDHFSGDDVAASYGVVHNPEVSQIHITLSLLYSRKPQEFVEDFKSKADKLTRKKIQKTVEQFVRLERTVIDIKEEATRMETERTGTPDVMGVIDALKRLKKLK